MEKNTKIISIIGILIILLVGILIYSSIYSNKNTEIKSISKGINPPKGNPEANVTIIEFSDFKCPACKAALPVIEEILSEYNTTIAFYYRNFPLPMHENSFMAAEAAECANEQWRFWQYHDILFANQENINKETLKLFAEQLNLTKAQFNSCLDSEKYKSDVQKDLNDGKNLRIKGTPTFFVNGEEVLGADKDKIKQLIEKELKK